jgi:thiamine-phosphate pyrophosphorylase
MIHSAGRVTARSEPILKLPRLYAIIDPAQISARSPAEICAELLASGVRLIQLRDKHAASGDFLEVALQLAGLVRDSGGTFILNDRTDVAIAANADGVHLGHEDLPVESARALVGEKRLIGYSTHNLDQLRDADSSSADYVAFGPVFATASKQNPDPVVGLEGLRAARKLTRKPLVAIGGITLENARAVLEAGADSVAVIRDLVGAGDVRRRAGQWIERLNF